MKKIIDVNSLEEMCWDDDYRLPIKGLFQGIGNEVEEEAFQMVGLLPNSKEKITWRFVEMHEFDSIRQAMEENDPEISKGLRIFFHGDDWSWVVYRDGGPVGSFYCSTRGPLYQAGCYRHADQKKWRKTNLGPKPRWKEVEGGIDCDIAEELLLGLKCISCGKRPFTPIPHPKRGQVEEVFDLPYPISDDATINFCSIACYDEGQRNAEFRRARFGEALKKIVKKAAALPPGTTPCYRCKGPMVGPGFVCQKCAEEIGAK